ncbi:MAG: hypothetical protein O7D31_10575 [Alphaproteobacteria bacterium]|nr:hypothetical protein [Alphaproteobacteria bacterium]
MNAYLFQSVPKTAGTDEYAEMIAQIEGTRDALQTLNEFLEKERKRVQETEEAVNRLTQEHDALLPVVQTKREDVEAILAVHARATKRSAWKERLVGFGLGLFASILTGGVFYLLEIWRQRLE